MNNGIEYRDFDILKGYITVKNVPMRYDSLSDEYVISGKVLSRISDIIEEENIINSKDNKIVINYSEVE